MKLPTRPFTMSFESGSSPRFLVASTFTCLSSASSRGALMKMLKSSERSPNGLMSLASEDFRARMRVRFPPPQFADFNHRPMREVGPELPEFRRKVKGRGFCVRNWHPLEVFLV